MGEPESDSQSDAQKIFQLETALAKVSMDITSRRDFSMWPTSTVGVCDQLAAQIAGRFLKQLIEEGYDSRREIYTMTVAEVLTHLDAVVTEAKDQGAMPALPVSA